MSDSNQIAAMLLAMARALGLVVRKCSCDDGRDGEWDEAQERWHIYTCYYCDGAGYKFEAVDE